tara:strand:- start:125 stop:526 length:402 start_codon:yes stop_codon:yes gene_type:complete
MKKLIFLLITLITLTSVSYASFPVTENTQSVVIETSRKVPMSDNLKILLLSLVPILAAMLISIISSVATGTGLLETFICLIAFLSCIYSLYLNFKTDIAFWDFRNYIALILGLGLGILSFMMTVLIFAYGGWN